MFIKMTGAFVVIYYINKDTNDNNTDIAKHKGVHSHIFNGTWMGLEGKNFYNSEVLSLGFRAHSAPFGSYGLSLCRDSKSNFGFLPPNKVMHWVQEITGRKERRHWSWNRIGLIRAVCTTLGIKRPCPHLVRVFNTV